MMRSGLFGGQQSNDVEPTTPTPLPVGERPPSRASEMPGEGSCHANSTPHPVCSLRSQTTLSPARRGSEWLVGLMPLPCRPLFRVGLLVLQRVFRLDELGFLHLVALAHLADPLEDDLVARFEAAGDDALLGLVAALDDKHVLEFVQNCDQPLVSH